MSVLSFPRIYFNGYMGWDPATGNNNDYQPINDGQNASLNWDYLNTYRRLISDVVLEDVELRLYPTEPLEGRVAVFTAGATDVSHIEHEIVQVCPHLADRSLLRSALVDADTYLVELKGAAIDVVAEHALTRGIRVVLAGNEVVAPGLDEQLLSLVPVAA